MSRQKGKRGEREAAHELGLLLGLAEGAARRGVQFAGGPDSPDVVLDGVAIHVEAKRVEALQLYSAIEQSTSDAVDKVPIVWHRRNGKPSVVVVETSRLLELAREIVRVTSAVNDGK